MRDVAVTRLPLVGSIGSEGVFVRSAVARRAIDCRHLPLPRRPSRNNLYAGVRSPRPPDVLHGLAAPRRHANQVGFALWEDTVPTMSRNAIHVRRVSEWYLVVIVTLLATFGMTGCVYFELAHSEKRVSEFENALKCHMSRMQVYELSRRFDDVEVLCEPLPLPNQSDPKQIRDQEISCRNSGNLYTCCFKLIFNSKDQLTHFYSHRLLDDQSPTRLKVRDPARELTDPRARIELCG